MKYTSNKKVKMIEPNKLFVYGLLKRGFELDLRYYENTKFISPAQLDGATLYSIGFGVGLRFTPEIPESFALGDVFEIPEAAWPWLDGIEQNGFAYTRKVVQVKRESGEILDAWVYEHTYPNMIYSRPILGGCYGKEYRHGLDRTI